MSAQITTAADLDALPMGSVVVDVAGDPWMKDTAFWIGPETAPATPDRLAKKWGPLTVVYRPDRDLIAEARAEGAREAAERIERAVEALPHAQGLSTIRRDDALRIARAEQTGGAS